MLLRKKESMSYLGMLAAGILVVVLALFLIAPAAHADGSSCNWQASYWNNMNLEGNPTLKRCDAAIDFDWHGLSPDPSINVDNFSARWVRTYQFAAGTYRFKATMDDGMRVWIDGHIIIDDWNEGKVRTDEVDVKLNAGPHKMVVEYYEKGGNAIAGFTWVALDGQPPSQPMPPPQQKPMPPMYPQTPGGMPPTGAVEYPVAEVKAAYLNVRSCAGVDSPVVGVLHQNTKVYLVGRDTGGKWVLIKVEGLSGWVNRYYLHTDFPYTSLQFIDSCGGQPMPPPQQKPVPENAAMVNVSALNVRVGPGVQYRAIAVVYGGTTVLVLEKEGNGWVKIQLPTGTVGYVNGAYLSY